MAPIDTSCVPYAGSLAHCETSPFISSHPCNILGQACDCHQSFWKPWNTRRDQVQASEVDIVYALQLPNQ
jgi:hypothetical protein